MKKQRSAWIQLLNHVNNQDKNDDENVWMSIMDHLNDENDSFNSECFDIVNRLNEQNDNENHDWNELKQNLHFNNNLFNKACLHLMNSMNEQNKNESDVWIELMNYLYYDGDYKKDEKWISMLRLYDNSENNNYRVWSYLLKRLHLDNYLKGVKIMDFSTFNNKNYTDPIECSE